MLSVELVAIFNYLLVTELLSYLRNSCGGRKKSMAYSFVASQLMVARW
jgi:hypothetical protein